MPLTGAKPDCAGLGRVGVGGSVSHSGAECATATEASRSAAAARRFRRCMWYSCSEYLVPIAARCDEGRPCEIPLACHGMLSSGPGEIGMKRRQVLALLGLFALPGASTLWRI